MNLAEPLGTRDMLVISCTDSKRCVCVCVVGAVVWHVDRPAGEFSDSTG